MSSENRGILSDVELRTPAGRFFVGVCFAALVLTALFILFPYFIALTTGLKSTEETFRPGLHLFPQNPNWGYFQWLLSSESRGYLANMFRNSLMAAGGGVAFQLIFSSLAAYSLSRLKPAGKKIIQTLILVSIALPFFACITPLYALLADVPVLHVSAINQWWGVWFPYANNGFTILVLQLFFDRIPKEIFDAARVDGASEVRMFLTFALPLTRTLLLVLGIFSFIKLWGDFLWPYLILRNESMRTISVVLAWFSSGGDPNFSMALSFIAMLPPTVAALILQRYMKEGLIF